MLEHSLRNARGPVVALLQEPYVYKSQVRGIGRRVGAVFAGHSETGLPTRVAIVATPGINSVIYLPQFCTRDQVAVCARYKCGGKDRRVVLASTYLPYDAPTGPPSNEMEQLVSYCSRENIPLVLGCDTNAHHTAWGSTNINERGRKLEEFVFGTNLVVANHGNQPTFVTTRRQEVIDVTFVSVGFASEVTGWYVSNVETLSDHRRICFRLGMDRQPTELWRNPRKTNWGTYSTKLACNLESVTLQVESAEEIEASASAIQSAIKDAYEKSCPLVPRRPRRGKTTWWSHTLELLKRETGRLLGRLRRTRNAADWALYQAARQEYKREIQAAKRRAWRDFCESVESQSDAARLQRVLCRDADCQIGLLKLQDGRYAADEWESLGRLLEVHFPDCVRKAGEAIPRCNNIRATPGDWRVARSIVSAGGVEWAIKRFEPYKAAGPDGIFPALLLRGLDLLTPLLCRLFQGCIAVGWIPSVWRQARVVFIPKPGRPAYDIPKAFRPISLTSFFVKTMERLVDRYVRGTALVRAPLQKGQHAFMAGRSTESALHALVQRIERGFDSGKYSLGVFLDIEGAFSYAPFHSILEALHQRRVEHTVIRWIEQLLRGQLTTASLGIATIEVQVRRGCPQGGCYHL